jgi:PAS domain S-box-containing protein
VRSLFSSVHPRRRLAALLRHRREELIRRWTRRVLEDPRVPDATRLSEPELHDHIPELLDRIAEDIEAHEGGALGACQSAREHARHRASEGYGLTEALRELSHFRAVILEICAEQRVAVEGDAAGLLHAAIDESMTTGADEMERAALEKGERLTELLDESHEAVLLWRLGGAIVSWNRGAEELYGWRASEAIGQSSHALLRTRQGGRGMDEVERILAREGRWKGELEHTARDGRGVLVEGRLVVRSHDGEALVLEMNRDITERRKAEVEREQLLGSERAARTEAERAAHLRDEFVATVSHELRTPLNAILGWTAMLRAGKLDAAATAKALEVVERNARAQAELVEDLLDLSRIGSGKLRLEVRDVSLAAILENVVASHQPAAQAKGVRLEKVLDDPCVVPGDPGRLEQIASNLLSNAIKFTPPGGRVSVLCQRAGPRVELVVSDTGKGFDAGFLPHMFDRFRQAEASLTRHHRGLGLGLSLVKFLVEQHGGDIRAESEGEGRGATFTVTLPSAAPGRAGARPSPIDACASLAGMKALVVDDEDDARALVDGYQLIRAARALAPEQGGSTPAVALTAFARPEDRLRALQAGYQMHVAKPVDPRELLVVVADVTGRLARPPAPIDAPDAA